MRTTQGSILHATLRAVIHMQLDTEQAMLQQQLRHSTKAEPAQCRCPVDMAGHHLVQC